MLFWLLSPAPALQAKHHEPAPVAKLPPAMADPAPLSELIDAVSIPYESFTLDNGLTVLVHTDRQASGSRGFRVVRGRFKHEQGQNRFAHLFRYPDVQWQ
ncbi:MAG: hypothetical protein R3E18_03265 [Sphingomonadaceae bacterium]